MYACKRSMCAMCACRAWSSLLATEMELLYLRGRSAREDARGDRPTDRPDAPYELQRGPQGSQGFPRGPGDGSSLLAMQLELSYRRGSRRSPGVPQGFAGVPGPGVPGGSLGRARRTQGVPWWGAADGPRAMSFRCLPHAMFIWKVYGVLYVWDSVVLSCNMMHCNVMW